jgi:ASC-1-like (ASCH) protein
VFDNGDFRAALWKALGIRMLDQPGDCCNITCRHFQDVHCLHADHCGNTGGIKRSRHNSVAKVLAELARKGNHVDVVLEKQLSFENKLRPGDVYVPDVTEDANVAFDITVASSMTEKSLLADDAHNIKTAQKVIDVGVNQVKAKKFKKYNDILTQDKSNKLEVIVLNNYGGFEGNALKKGTFLKQLLKRAREVNPKDQMNQWYLCKHSVQFWKIAAKAARLAWSSVIRDIDGDNPFRIRMEIVTPPTAVVGG